MPFWSKHKAPAGAGIVARIRKVASLDQRSGIVFHEVKDESEHIAAELAALDDDTYAAVLRDLLRQPGGVFQASHLPAAVFGTSRARATLTTARDVDLLSDILIQSYRPPGLGIKGSPYTFLMGPVKGVLMAAVAALRDDDAGNDHALSTLVELLALEHPQLADVTGRCLPRMRQLSRAHFNALLGRWMGANRCLGKQLSALREGLSRTPDAFESFLTLLLDAPNPDPTASWQRDWEITKSVTDPQHAHDVLMRITEIGVNEPALGEGEPVSLTRGAIWALGDWQDGHTRDLLESIVLAEVPRDVPANAALWSLARPHDDESISRLLTVINRVRHRGLKTRAEQMVRRAAEARSQTPETMADELVPDYGLNSDGARSWASDEYRIQIQIQPDGTVDRTITTSEGRRVSSAPRALQDDANGAWQEIGRTTKELKSTLTQQKHRFEDAMVLGRSWSKSEWQQTIADNPVMFSLAKRLVWKVTDDGRDIFAMPGEGARWLSATATEPIVSDRATIALPHLLTMPEVEVESWRRRIVADGIVQPFRQMFREVYSVTPVEREAGDHSSRFAGHAVPLAQVYALTKTRGWKGKLGLAGFYGAGEGWKEFPAKNVRVVLRHAGEDPQVALGVVEEISI